MLTGCPPFFAKDKNEIFKSIVNKDPGFGNMQNKLSEDAVDLVKAMLNKSPSERITMQEVLNHPWLNSNVRSEVLDLDRAEDITKNLTIFHKQSVFQTGVVSFISGMMQTGEELKDYKKMFLALDKSQDGYLSPEELKSGMNMVVGNLKASDTDWLALVDQLDSNNDGRIDYAEFVTAAIDRRILLSQENLT